MPLVVDGNRINKISGPVSMSILTPKKSELFPNLPVYMLFGDVHNDNRNMCKEGKSKGVYSVYDIEFLSLLSNVATSTRPIDFYIEGGDLHNKIHKRPYSEKYPMEMLWNLYAECYTHNGRKIARYKHRTKCNTISNIRWHSGDARYFDDKKYTLENCNMLRFLERVNFSVKYDDRYLEIVNMVNRACNTKLSKRKEETNDYTSLKDLVLQRDGLIYKQLKKIKPNQRKLLIGWIEKFCKYRLSNIHRNYGITDRTIELYNYLDLHLPRCQSEDYYNKYLSDHWESISSYLSYLRRKYTIILDIYTICRSFKYLGLKGPMPTMNIIYAGDIHTNDIKYFLESITSLYNVQTVEEFNGDFNNPNRCVQIRDKIDLGVILNQNVSNIVVSKKNRRVISKRKRVSPRRKRVSPKRKRTYQKRKRVNQKRKRVSPKRKRVSPKKKRVSPKRKRVLSKKKRVSPKRKRVSPKRKRVSPKKKRLLSKKKRVSPKRKRVSPKRKRVSPKKKRVSPKRKRVSPKKKRVSPKRKRPLSKRKRVSPKKKRVSPKRKRVSPKKKRVSKK